MWVKPQSLLRYGSYFQHSWSMRRPICIPELDNLLAIFQLQNSLEISFHFLNLQTSMISRSSLFSIRSSKVPRVIFLLSARIRCFLTWASVFPLPKAEVLNPEPVDLWEWADLWISFRGPQATETLREGTVTKCSKTIQQGGSQAWAPESTKI